MRATIAPRSPLSADRFASLLCELTALTASKQTNLRTAAAAVPRGEPNALPFLNRAQLQPDDTVLVNGAGGNIGAHAVQLAKAMGSRVMEVDHGCKKAFLRRFGVDAFIDYRQIDFTASAWTSPSPRRPGPRWRPW